MSTKKGAKKKVNISAVTGRYVTESYAEAHPKTTVKLTVPVKKKSK